MSIIEKIEKEIEETIKASKPIHITLKKSEYDYRCSKILEEGDYLLTYSKKEAIKVSVIVDENTSIVNGFDEEEEEVQVILIKDSTTLLNSVKERLKITELPVTPSFLVGPPGTGKSTVIVRTIEEALKNNQRVLVLSPTNMAVENVFERIDLKKLNLNDGEVILSVLTDSEALKSFSPEILKKNQKNQIQDEADMLVSMNKELLKKRRDIETESFRIKAELEQNSIMASNLQRDLKEKQEQKSIEIIALEDLEKRLKLIKSNTLINNISRFFDSNTSDKELELDSNIELKKKIIAGLETKISGINQRLEELENKELISAVDEKQAQTKELVEAIEQVNSRIKLLNKKLEELEKSNPFKEAKLVGATLQSAAVNNKLQLGEFDKILIDEASMALYPQILSASQCLNKTVNSKIEITKDSKMTVAQNDGVKLLANSKLALIGDPRQLSPIAQTEAMRETIFDLFQIDKLFKGEEVENTVFLDVNFRNHPDIVKLASSMFYGGLLKSGKKDNALSSLFLCKSNTMMTRVGSSYENRGNQNIIYQQVEKALKAGRRSIGVVTPYRAQADALNELFKPLLELYPDADLTAGTVHKFQGKEKDIIIFDICASVSNGATLPRTYQGGLNSEVAKLLNVAMTRAETLFILVGDIDGIKAMKENNLLKKWIKNIETLKQ